MEYLLLFVCECQPLSGRSRVVSGIPSRNLGSHICRDNWRKFGYEGEINAVGILCVT